MLRKNKLLPRKIKINRKTEEAHSEDDHGNHRKAIIEQKRQRKVKDSDSSDEKIVDYNEDDFEVAKDMGNGALDNKEQDVEEKIKCPRKKKPMIKKNDAMESSTSKKSQKSNMVNIEEEDSTQDINVHDAYFHEFNMDWTKNDYEVDQIWAIYDDDDGMLRFDGHTNKCIS